MDIKDIKDKRQEVACELRRLAKQEWMSIDIDDIHQMIFVSHYIFSTFIFLTGVLFISCLLSFPILNM